MNVVKNTKQQITQDLNTVVQDIRQRGQGSYFENSGFSFDSMIAKEALERFKQEAANEVGVNLKNGYNGDLTSRQAGSIGGQMVKKMIESYENTMK